MTLDTFLAGKTVEAVDTLPDDRLINVVLAGGALYGVTVDEVPSDVPVTRRAPVTTSGTDLLVDGLMFDTTAYTLLDGDL